MGTRFEIGKVYKTREGQELEFVAHVPLAKPEQRALFMTKAGGILCRCEDGRWLENRNNLEDVIQPPLTLIQYSVIWYQRNAPDTLYRSGFYSTKEAAEYYAKRLIETDKRRVILPIQVTTYEVQE